jgi:hypothetical protein
MNAKLSGHASEASLVSFLFLERKMTKDSGQTCGKFRLVTTVLLLKNF